MTKKRVKKNVFVLLGDVFLNLFIGIFLLCLTIGNFIIYGVLFSASIMAKFDVSNVIIFLLVVSMVTTIFMSFFALKYFEVKN